MTSANFQANSICRLLLLCVLGNLATFIPVTADETSSIEAVENAIDYLKKGGEGWIKKRGCVSCHQVPAMLWSLGEAQRSGLDVSEQDLKRWADWSTDPVNFVKPEQKEDVDVQETMAGNIDTMAGLLLAIPNDQPSPWRKIFIAKICQEQANDGSWKACGQLPLQKRPQLETTQTTTLWVTLALLKHNSTDFNFENAIQFSDSGPPAKSTEWYAVRLMVAGQCDEASSEQRHADLIRHQNADGGWGWITGDPSDALATGIALYSLSQYGSDNAEVTSNAANFLIKTQTEAGNWKVPGTKTASKHKSTATSDYWGTAWAVISLSAGTAK